MATSEKPNQKPPKDWPAIHRPPGIKTRDFLRSLLAGGDLTVITDALQKGKYWAIVKDCKTDATPYALLCLTHKDGKGTMHYLIVPEAIGFPDIPPQKFFAQILRHCPAAPSEIAKNFRARAEKRYAELAALPDYPVGTEFSILDVRFRIIEKLGRRGWSAIKTDGTGGQFLIKREHMLSAVIHSQPAPAGDAEGSR